MPKTREYNERQSNRHPNWVSMLCTKISWAQRLAPIRILNVLDIAALQSLWFPGMEFRQHTIANPMQHTCAWLFEHDKYKAWRNRVSLRDHHGLLWIKGNPGSGKSTLMKAAFAQVVHDSPSVAQHTAAFFFNARGQNLEQTPLGMLRCLLHQLLRQSPVRLRSFSELYQRRKAAGGGEVNWHEEELRDFFKGMFTTQRPSPPGAVIFVDALDECESELMRNLVYFLREVTSAAYQADVALDVCMSSRQFPAVNLSSCPEIIVERFNHADIRLYINHRLAVGGVPSDDDWDSLKNDIHEKSAGVFLWAVLTVDMLLTDRDNGWSVSTIRKMVHGVPPALESIFTQLMQQTPPQEVNMTVRFFQWLVFLSKPLRLREWHHILAFIRDGVPASLEEWRRSDHHTESDEQLERRIRSISKGLAEVTSQGYDAHGQDRTLDLGSVRAGAGSLDAEHGETRIVQVVHQSVRAFFIEGGGFSALDGVPAADASSPALGHMTIINTCLRYIRISELDALVEARMKQWMPKRSRRTRASGSVASFESAGSRCSGESSNLPANKPASPKRRSSLDAPLPVLGGPRVSASGAPTRRFLFPGQPSPARPDMAQTEQCSVPSPFDVHQWLNRVEQLGDSNETKHGPNVVPGGEPLSNHEASRSHARPYDDSQLESGSQGPSAAGRSQVLEDFPALLGFITTMFPYHATAADAAGADATALVEELVRSSTWARFLCLRELVPYDMPFAEYAAQENLPTWVRGLLNVGTDPSALPGDDERVNSGLTVLHAATRSNRVSTVEMILDMGGDVNSRDEDDMTPLHIAAASPDSLHLVELFLSRGCDVCAEDDRERTALHLACSRTDSIIAELELLIFHGSDINASDEDGWTPLHNAVENENLEATKLLLKHGADVCAEDDHGRTALHLACSRTVPIIAELELLILHGSDINVGDTDGRTPLHNVVLHDNLEATKLLLKHGADVCAKDNYKRTALHLACLRTDYTIAELELLVFYGSDVNISDKGGCTLLHNVVLHDNLEATKLLLKHGADVSAQNDNGGGVLHMAHSGAMVNALVDAGADPSQVNSQQESPLSTSARWESPLSTSAGRGCTQALIDRGANVNQQNIHGDTALHDIADRNLSLEAAHRLIVPLIRGGADLTLENNAGLTPLTLAWRRNRWPTACILELLAAQDCPQSRRADIVKRCKEVRIVSLLVQSTRYRNSS